MKVKNRSLLRGRESATRVVEFFSRERAGRLAAPKGRSMNSSLLRESLRWPWRDAFSGGGRQRRSISKAAPA